MVFLKIELLSTFTLINKNIQATFTFYLFSQGKSKFGGKSKNFHQSAHHCPYGSEVRESFLYK